MPRAKGFGAIRAEGENQKGSESIPCDRGTARRGIHLVRRGSSPRSIDCSSMGGSESGGMRWERSLRRTSSGMTSVPSSRLGSESGTSCGARDRKSTRLNSSHLVISYAVFCLKKKKNTLLPFFLIKKKKKKQKK